MDGASVIIPTWNGWHLLEKNLPHLLEVLQKDGDKHELIIVDDGSTDDTSSKLSKKFPTARVIRLETNRGFAYACNEGVQASKKGIVYLLNNDVVVERDFLDHILPHFKNDNIFAVASKEGDKNYLAIVSYRYGIFWRQYVEIKDLGSAIPALFASGGHSAFSKEKYLLLGGFDTLYHPFYWEDIDISYRAWKRGWVILYEPKSRVHHHHQSTIGNYYSKGFIHRIYWRNKFLFTWRNLRTRGLWIKHLFFLPLELVILPVIGKGYFSAGFLQALKFIRAVNERRKKERNISVYSDIYVIDKINECLYAKKHKEKNF